MAKYSAGTKHKPQKDSVRNKELAELKRENRTLRRQVSILKKRIMQLIEAGIGAEVQAQEEPVQKQPPQEKCSTCHGTDIRKVTLPSGTVIRCMGCLKTRMEKP